MGKKTIPLDSGKLYQAPIETSWFRFLCCDCGLVHDIEISRAKGSLYFKMSRNQASTGQYRRFRGYPYRDKKGPQLYNQGPRVITQLQPKIKLRPLKGQKQ